MSNQYMVKRVQHFLQRADEPLPGIYINKSGADRSIRYVRQDPRSGQYSKILVLEDGSYSGSQAQSIIERICHEMDRCKVSRSARSEVVITDVTCSGPAGTKIVGAASRDERIQLMLIPAPIRIMTIRETAASRDRSLQQGLDSFPIDSDQLNAWTAAIFRSGQLPMGANMTPLGNVIRLAWKLPPGGRYVHNGTAP